jgi:hypothetical protein
MYELAFSNSSILHQGPLEHLELFANECELQGLKTQNALANLSRERIRTKKLIIKI